MREDATSSKTLLIRKRPSRATSYCRPSPISTRHPQCVSGTAPRTGLERRALHRDRHTHDLAVWRDVVPVRWLQSSKVSA
jgi:hypothetical protein